MSTMDEELTLAATANSDLPLTFLADVLVARDEAAAGLGEPYKWGVLGSDE